MLTSIHPLGERARHNRWSVTASAYAASCLAGGLVIGAAAGLVGAAVRAVANPSMVTVAAIAFMVTAVALVAELGWAPVPTVHRQVQKEWLDELRGWVYGAGFGLQLGLGVVTTVTTATIYAALAFAVLTGTVVGGSIVGAGFGLARALPILAVRRVVDGRGLRSVHARFQALAASGRAVELMRANDIFISLFDYGVDSARLPLFAKRMGMPTSLMPDQFDRSALQRTLPGQCGTQVFFADAGRGFCLYVVLGSWRDRVALHARANELVSAVVISPS